MKKLLLICTLFFVTFSGFAQIKSVPEFRAKKIEFYCEDDFSKVVKSIDNELNLLEQHKSEYDEELFLTIKNALLVDKLFFSLENDELPKNKKDEFKKLFLDQEKICDDFIGKKDLSQFSGDFLASLGDLKCQMPFVISIPSSIPKLTKAKDLYNNGAKNNPSCGNLISQALWYEYSPGISGGSHKKAYEIIQKAEKAATTDGDKYFALMFKGQILVSLKRIDEANVAFKTAHNMFPNETFTDYMEKKLEITLNF